VPGRPLAREVKLYLHRTRRRSVSRNKRPFLRGLLSKPPKIPAGTASIRGDGGHCAVCRNGCSHRHLDVSANGPCSAFRHLGDHFVQGGGGFRIARTRIWGWQGLRNCRRLRGGG
jgi:hypothetical protein